MKLWPPRQPIHYQHLAVVALSDPRSLLSLSLQSALHAPADCAGVKAHSQRELMLTRKLQSRVIMALQQICSFPFTRSVSRSHCTPLRKSHRDRCSCCSGRKCSLVARSAVRDNIQPHSLSSLSSPGVHSGTTRALEPCTSRPAYGLGRAEPSLLPSAYPRPALLAT